MTGQFFRKSKRSTQGCGERRESRGKMKKDKNIARPKRADRKEKII